jgi:DNA-binding response OmpR family regulator
MANKILFSEDESGTRKVISLWLRKAGYEVVEAQNGVDAWEKLQDYVPDMVITDLSMPEMGGMELCRKIKLSDKLAGVPVIVFTSHDEVDRQVEGAAAGADAYLSKDTDLRVLLARIDVLLKEKNRHDEETAREVATIRKATLAQSVTTLAHHISNGIMAIHSAASVIDPENIEHVQRLQNVCQTESRKILHVLKALKKMAEYEELKTTTYVGDELMFDLDTELENLGGQG